MSTTAISPASPVPPRYLAETGWPPLMAVLAGALVVALSMATGFAVFVALTGLGGVDLGTISDATMPVGLALVSQFLMQIVTVLLVWWIAGWHGSRRTAALSFNGLPGGPMTIAKGFALLLVVSGLFTLIAVTIAPSDLRNDLQGIWPLMRGETWWLMALVAVIGAPLSEEILFRGFLQSALAKSALGFWGAGLITNTAWALMHVNYSLTGLADVFVAGLVFTYLLWRTGSLWVPIICHGLYNAIIFVVLWLAGGPDALFGGVAG